VYELEDRLIVMVEVPVCAITTLIYLVPTAAVIAGFRQRLAMAADCAYHQLEIHYGEFRTEVGLPAVWREQVSAVYQNGLLRIELPRARLESAVIYIEEPE